MHAYLVQCAKSHRTGCILPLNIILLLIACAHVQENNFFKISRNCLVEVVYYSKQAYHLLYVKGVKPAEDLHYFSSILYIVV